MRRCTGGRGDKAKETPRLPNRGPAPQEKLLGLGHRIVRPHRTGDFVPFDLLRGHGQPLVLGVAAGHRHAAGDHRPLRGPAGAARLQGDLQRGQGRRLVLQPRADRPASPNCPTAWPKPATRWSGIGEAITAEMEKKISMLAVLGTLGPMIGLLGTLKGMIASFSVIATLRSAVEGQPGGRRYFRSPVLTFEGVALSVPSIYFFAVVPQPGVDDLGDLADAAADQFLRHFAHAGAGKPAAAAAAATATQAAKSLAWKRSEIDACLDPYRSEARKANRTLRRCWTWCSS